MPYFSPLMFLKKRLCKKNVVFFEQLFKFFFSFFQLILYLFSHMSRCPQMPDGMQQSLLPEAPPSYDNTCPPYLPPQIYQRANESSGSSWSLSTEALKGETSSNVSDIQSIRRQIITQEQLANMMSRENAQEHRRPLINTDDYSALPY